jgi:hypothetical protein
MERAREIEGGREGGICESESERGEFSKKKRFLVTETAQERYSDRRQRGSWVCSLSDVGYLPDLYEFYTYVFMLYGSLYSTASPECPSFLF